MAVGPHLAPSEAYAVGAGADALVDVLPPAGDLGGAAIGAAEVAVGGPAVSRWRWPAVSARTSW
ncbi:hypothetical protein CLM62_36455 [Streptomyces sp. SA15]|uniref:hypothetical protein n=1 Tax=Streptomyces sp. SA15 TaxID=934019 RepID=UPI000BAFC452|nr:hypothetical protein [Streptomyces sp. SA15]PAZ11234.1 hypothetical protein CLM62_36455 [Streptomyces sp. SA15]